MSFPLLKKKPKAVTRRHPRVVTRGDGYKVIAMGRHKRLWGDSYASLLGASWRKTILIVVALYFAINMIFAFAYLSTDGGIVNAQPGSFGDAFFFSVQTLATIGYGGMSPHGLFANTLVTIEAMVGFAFYGLLTGLVFSKFSRPTARILFSDKAVISMHEGKPHFMLRLANERDNRIVDATAKLTLMRDETTAEGVFMRRFYDLPLVRKEIPVLRLTWTVMHEIDEHSPLRNVSAESLSAAEAEIIVSVKGLDETFSQTIHARHSYIAEEIACDSVFEDIINRREDYVVEVNYDKFHTIKKKGK